MPDFPRFGRHPQREAARRLYDAVVAQARRPEFFLGCGVPDTLDGRFELICLHAFLVLNRLKGEGGAAAALGQELCEALFLDMDRGLREIGVGDLGVGRQVKRMASGFYGRLAAYERGLAEGEGKGEAGLGGALRRNLYGTAAPSDAAVAALAAYLRQGATSLTRQATGRLLAGAAEFPPPPELAGDGRGSP